MQQICQELCARSGATQVAFVSKEWFACRMTEAQRQQAEALLLG